MLMRQFSLSLPFHLFKRFSVTFLLSFIDHFLILSAVFPCWLMKFVFKKFRFWIIQSEGVLKWSSHLLSFAYHCTFDFFRLWISAMVISCFLLVLGPFSWQYVVLVWLFPVCIVCRKNCRCILLWIFCLFKFNISLKLLYNEGFFERPGDWNLFKLWYWATSWSLLDRSFAKICIWSLILWFFKDRVNFHIVGRV